MRPVSGAAHQGQNLLFGDVVEVAPDGMLQARCSRPKVDCLVALHPTQQRVNQAAREFHGFHYAPKCAPPGPARSPWSAIHDGAAGPRHRARMTQTMLRLAVRVGAYCCHARVVPRSTLYRRRPIRTILGIAVRVGLTDLVNELQRKLNLPPRLCCRERPGTRSIEAADQAVCPEIRVVDHIEELEPKLQLGAFLHREVLEK
jgi:hypothetical protein